MLPALPQSPNQEPLRPQQLTLPDFFAIPHLGHTMLMIIVVTAVVCYVQTLVKTKSEKRETFPAWSKQGSVYMSLAQNLRLQASTPSDHL